MISYQGFRGPEVPIIVQNCSLILLASLLPLPLIPFMLYFKFPVLSPPALLILHLTARGASCWYVKHQLGEPRGISKSFLMVLANHRRNQITSSKCYLAFGIVLLRREQLLYYVLRTYPMYMVLIVWKSGEFPVSLLRRISTIDSSGITWLQHHSASTRQVYFPFSATKKEIKLR